MKMKASKSTAGAINLQRLNPPSNPSLSPAPTEDATYVDPIFNPRKQRQLTRLNHYKLISISLIPAGIFFIVVGIIIFSLAAQNEVNWLNLAQNNLLWITAPLTMAIGIACVCLALIGLVAICIAKGNTPARERGRQLRPISSGRTTSGRRETTDQNFHGLAALSQHQTYDHQYAHSYGHNVHGPMSSRHNHHAFSEDDHSSANQNHCSSNDFASDPPPSYDASTGGCDDGIN